MRLLKLWEKITLTPLSVEKTLKVYIIISVSLLTISCYTAVVRVDIFSLFLSRFPSPIIICQLQNKLIQTTIVSLKFSLVCSASPL